MDLYLYLVSYVDDEGIWDGVDGDPLPISEDL